MSLETRQRVMEVAKQLGYVRNPMAAALQRGYSDTIVLLTVTWERTASHSDTIVGLGRAAATRGLVTCLLMADSDEQAEQFLKDRVPTLQPYGVVLLWDATHPPQSFIHELVAGGLPVVDMMPPEGTAIVSVTSDREQGCRLCAEHLISLGHTKIGMIVETAYGWRVSAPKVAGYRRAFTDAGIDPDDSLLQETKSFGFRAGNEALRALLERHSDMTAVMTTGHGAAVGAIAAAQELGLQVPADLSVAGYDTREESDLFQPNVTTVAASAVRLAEQAVETLVRMRQEPGYAPVVVYEPMELIIGDSTAPPRKVATSPGRTSRNARKASESACGQ